MGSQGGSGWGLGPEFAAKTWGAEGADEGALPHPFPARSPLGLLQRALGGENGTPGERLRVGGGKGGCGLITRDPC